MRYLLAIDQGTTSSRAILFDEHSQIIAVRQKETMQFYPKSGWIEQNPQDIWATTYGVLQEVLAMADISPKEIVGIGITNQRETTIVWDKETGSPVYPAIVWQCRRTADICENMIAEGLTDTIREKTGLVIDSYFSATKLKWILDEVDPDREKAKSGQLLFGTVDTWLLWKLTEGRVHATDYTNASRTMLFNIQDLKWDQDLLEYFDIPEIMLPEVFPSSHIFGYWRANGSDEIQIPIAGIAGDQQSALFGQTCFHEGEVKNTYGTGCFLLMNTGKTPVWSKQGLVTTIAASGDQTPNYALEGSIFIGGAVIQWIRDEMRFIDESSDSEFFAQKIKDNGGVYLVPAFVGLGAPYWDMYARGAIFGLTRGTSRSHIIRAALEAIAYQTQDVLRAMEADTGLKLEHLSVDGGAAKNDFLMQFQADMINVPVERPKVTETTALGAAYLAGLAIGLWENEESLKEALILDQRFVPEMSEEERARNYAGWRKALERTLEKKNKKIVDIG